MKSKGKIRPGDILVCALVLALGCALLLLPRLWRDPGGYAQVEVDGQVVAEIRLDGPDEDIRVEAGDLSFVLRREGGAIAMAEIDCPDHICERTGFISAQGQMIICLPNRVSVQIVGAQEGEVDVVVG